MAPIFSFNDVYLHWGPNDATVEAGLPPASVGTTSSGQSPIDDVEFVGHKLLAIQYVGYTWLLHPPHRIATGRSCALCAKEGVVTPEEGVR